MEKKVIQSCNVTQDLLMQLVSDGSSFEIECRDSHDMGNTIDTLECVIESQGKQCRVYTAWRSIFVVLLIATCFIPGLQVVMWVPALVAVLFIVLHNWWTYNPDYEIAKHLKSNRLPVKKQKVEFSNEKRVSRWHCLQDALVDFLIVTPIYLFFSLIGSPNLAREKCGPLFLLLKDKRAKNKTYK